MIKIQIVNNYLCVFRDVIFSEKMSGSDSDDMDSAEPDSAAGPLNRYRYLYLIRTCSNSNFLK
jgi:hypothetical protein